MPRDTLSHLFSWRSAVASTDGPRDREMTVRKRDGADSVETVRGPTQRHVALTISLHMSERGDSCFPGVARTARESGLAERSVQRAIRALEEGGWLRVEEGRGREGTNLYTATIPSGYEHDLGGDATSPGVTPRPKGGDATSPESDNEGDKVRTPPSPPSDLCPATVNKARVTAEERLLAVSVLGEFNRQAGTKYASGEFLGKIVMRHREHPEVDFVGHAEMIARQLARPWWTGTPSPSVVYGSGGLFERALQTGPPGGTTRFADLDDV